MVWKLQVYNEHIFSKTKNYYTGIYIYIYIGTKNSK